MKHFLKFRASGLAAVALLGLVAACSSSGNKASDTSSPNGTSSSSGAGTSDSSTTATGSPIKLMIVGIKNNPIVSQPELFAGAQARVDAINSSGGVAGHKLVLEECDSNLDPNREVACANQAVSDHVSALVGSVFIYNSLKPLETAKIPLVLAQASGPDELTSPVSFPNGGIISWFVGTSVMAKADGVKNLKIWTLDNPVGALVIPPLEQANKQLGITTADVVKSPSTATDFTADAATLMRGNPDAIVSLNPQTQTVKMTTALRAAGYKGKIYASSTAVADPKAYGSAGDGLRVAGGSAYPSDTSNPQVKLFIDEMGKYASGQKIDEYSELGWSSVDVYARVMKTAKSFTGPDTLAAFNAVTQPVTAGTYGPFVGAGTPTLPQFPRAINIHFFPGTLQDGVVKGDGGSVDISKALSQ